MTASPLPARSTPAANRHQVGVVWFPWRSSISGRYTVFLRLLVRRYAVEMQSKLVSLVEGLSYHFAEYDRRELTSVPKAGRSFVPDASPYGNIVQCTADVIDRPNSVGQQSHISRLTFGQERDEQGYTLNQ